MSFFKTVISLVTKYWPIFLNGIQYTIVLALVGTSVGLIIGLIVGGLRAIVTQHEPHETRLTRIVKKIIDIITKIYITVVRGTPMMVQAMFLWYGMMQGAGWDELVGACLIISLNTGAYMAEIVRSGIQAIDKGQTEGARSIGMSAWQTMSLIILPQALKNSIPSIVNELIVNIKDSCVLSVMMMPEVFFQAKSIAGSTLKFYETYFILMVIYLFLTSVSAWIMGLVEKKINHTKSNYFSSQTFVNEDGGNAL